ncbi:hypothetical protein WA026_006051 [Henosepilachna vigintioctopunctata]|uniref:Nose resistant-to-fluoxetine protein N-terminal domain-containing protein n=1 Tax=Henosepilachna vigintioctopunctata TaxID=420089 RepID=A0AAW1TMS1_9CUCU
MNWLKIIFLCLCLENSLSFDFGLLINNNSAKVVDLLIPTVLSDNNLCKKHSLLYRDELQKFTAWSMEMFDSTTKFPTGILFGSTYDTGNFDECISVDIPENIGFSGQHCMAHFRISSFKTLSNASYSYKDEKLSNISIWDKIALFATDPRRKSRKDIHISYCIPSSCTHNDLQIVLQKNAEIFSEKVPFNLDVAVNKRNCQTQTERKFTNGDKIFLGVVLIVISFEVMCTLYHGLTKSGGVKHLKLPGKLHDILKAFSFSHTIKKLTKISQRDDGLECLNGMKVISTLFVIMGHRLMFSTSSSIGNPIYMEEAYEKPAFAGFFMGPVVVDTFYTISGFLACYCILTEIHRTKGKANLAYVVLHRIVRLTPAYAVVLGFYMTIFSHLGNGPFWSERVEVEQERCIENWWTNLLYINNYVNVEKSCMFHTWYLASDMQLFLSVPILAYILWKKPRIGMICCVAITLIAMVLNFMVIYINEEQPFILLYLGTSFIQDPVADLSYQRIHIPSHVRASPYFIGVITAYLKFEYRKSEYKISSCIKYLGWTIFAAIFYGIQTIGMYFYSPTESKNYVLRGLFGTAHHSFWGLAIAWCIIAVSEGHGEIAAYVLKGRVWTVLSKITLTTYICQAAIQVYTIGTLRYPKYAGLFNLYFHVAADAVFAYMIGFLLSLVFEAPIIELEEILFRKDSRKPIQKTIDLTERPKAGYSSKEN